MNCKAVRVARLLILAVAVALVAGPAFSADPPKKKPQPKTKPDGPAVAAKLREEWDLGHTRMMKLVIKEAKFSPTIKRTCGAAAQKFIDDQETLLGKVEKDAAYEPDARIERAKQFAEFNRAMGKVYKDDAMKKEFQRRMRAMEKELDDVAAGSDALLAKIEASGATAAQKEKIKPLLDEAKLNVNSEVTKTNSSSVKDPKAKEQAVKKYEETRAKIQEQLTEEQKEKLNKKLADEP